MLEKEPLKVKPCLDDPAGLSSRKREELGIREKFPRGINDALKALGSNAEMKSVLGESVVQTFIVVKTAEQGMLSQMAADRRRNWLIERY